MDVILYNMDDIGIEYKQRCSPLIWGGNILFITGLKRKVEYEEKNNSNFTYNYGFFAHVNSKRL